MTSLPLSTPLFVVIVLVAIVAPLLSLLSSVIFCNENNHHHCLRQLCSYLLSLSNAHPHLPGFYFHDVWVS